MTAATAPAGVNATVRARSRSAWRGRLVGMLLAAVCAVALAPASTAARASDAQASVATRVDAAEGEMDLLSRQAERAQDQAARARLIERANRLNATALRLQLALTDPLAAVQQRIAQLGPEPAKSADADIRRQFRELNLELGATTALSRRTALVDVESRQLLDRLGQAQAQALGREILAHGGSPLAPGLWMRAWAQLPRDLARNARNAPRADAARSTGASTPGARAGLLALWLAMAVLLLWPVRLGLEWTGLRAARRLGQHEPRFSVTLFALWSVVFATVLATVCGWALWWLADTLALPPAPVAAARALAVAAVLGAYVRSLGIALAQPSHPPLRLLPLSDPAAGHAARAATALACAMAGIVLSESLRSQLALAPATALAVNALQALLSTACLVIGLRALGRARGSELEAADDSGRPGALTLLTGLGWIAVVVLVLAGMVGYVNFANRISQWWIWGAVVVGSAWLLMAFADSLCKALLKARPRRGRQQATLSRTRPLDQGAVLLSAVLRLLILCLACGALLVPFGAGFTSVLALFADLARGVEVAGISISAVSLLRAVIAFLVVLAIAKFVRAWLANSYLPTTSLQPDARDSVDTILRYLGIVLAVLWALTAFGIGMEKVAILASALSVGIGFGLQAITQNFVSGLILLVERPVKIGDWVKLGDMEGDIRRINVRSTEIRVNDHSTLIVPNSELVTKVVRNMTKAGSLGRAQLKIAIPLEADLEQAVAVVAEVLAADDAVLEKPAPGVYVDQIENGMVVLNCFVHVRAPREAYATRSRLILAVIRTLKDRDIPVALPPQQLVLSPAPPE